MLNADKLRANNRRYHDAHKDELNANRRQIYATDAAYREQTRKRVAKRRMRKLTEPEFREEVNAKEAAYRRGRYRTDNDYRFQRKLSNIRYEERREAGRNPQQAA